MLGHMVGMVFQLATESACNAVTLNSNKIVCTTSGIFVHEFIVEPIVNSVVAAYLMTAPTFIHGPGCNHQADHYNYARLALGAAGALVVGQSSHHMMEAITDHLGHDDHKADEEHDHAEHSWAHIIVESFGSLGGSIIGYMVYDTLLQQLLVL